MKAMKRKVRGKGKDRNQIEMEGQESENRRKLLWTAVGEVRKGGEMGRRKEGSSTSHPLSDLWVAVMTDGESL